MSPKSTLLKAEILRGLDALSEGGLDEVHAHVTSLVEATGRNGSARESLAGIWKGRGFERLSDLAARFERHAKNLVQPSTDGISERSVYLLDTVAWFERHSSSTGKIDNTREMRGRCSSSCIVSCGVNIKHRRPV